LHRQGALEGSIILFEHRNVAMVIQFPLRIILFLCWALSSSRVPLYSTFSECSLPMDVLLEYGKEIAMMI
jgi:hypothetical protein